MRFSGPVRPEVSKDRAEPVEASHSFPVRPEVSKDWAEVSKPCSDSTTVLFAAFRCRSVAAAGDLHFFVSPKKPKEKKGDPTVCVPPLRYGQPPVLASSGVPLELAALRQSRALIRLKLRSSAHTQGVGLNSDSGSIEPAARAQCCYFCNSCLRTY